MRIGIDARMLGKGFGLARYVEQLVLHLEKIDTQNEYVLFLKRDNWNAFEPQNKNFKKVLAPIAWYSFAEQLKFPKIIQKEKLDIMHFPHFNVPLLYRGPYVITIHDLIMFHYPRSEASTHGPLVYYIKDCVHRVVVRVGLRRAKHVLVTSEFTKRDVFETLHVPMSKMTVTYQAPFESKTNQSGEDILLLKKYNITKPYLLYVGAAYPHKNIKGLLESWNIFQKKYGKDYELVLVGKENFFYTQLKNTVFKQTSNFVYTGFVPDDELSFLYKNAQLYVFPSFYEGFGLPPLEAMTHGIAVVSSKRSCLPEVLGNAALYFDPENFEEMADIFFEVLKDPQKRLELAQNAAKLLPRYSWDTLAKETLGCYTQKY